MADRDGSEGGLPHGLRASPLPSAVLDVHGAWRELNPALDRLLGEPRPSFRALVAEPALDLGVVLAAGRPVTLPIRLPGGAPADALVTSLSDDGPFRLVQLRDRSEVDQLEERLLEAATAAERFASRVSHDLKNPIGTAGGYAELLATEATLSDEGRSFVTRILSSAQRALDTLVEIVEDARTASRVVPPDEVDLSELVDEVRAELADLLAARGAVVAAAELPTVRGDRRILHRAVAALVANAVEHHPGSARVQVSARPVPEGWSLDVDDDGPGIPEDQREAALGLGTGAAGVGLALTRVAIARRGGELRLGTSDAGGLRARLVIPQRRARDPDVPPL